MEKRILKKIKKELKNFMKDESGKVSKENILKIGIATIGTLGWLSVSNVMAHTNYCNDYYVLGSHDSGKCKTFTPQLHHDHYSY